MKKSNPVLVNNWQAEDDANILARAAEIKADKSRMKKASQAAKKMVEKEAVRVRAMKRIAAMKTNKKPKKKAKKKAKK